MYYNRNRNNTYGNKNVDRFNAGTIDAGNGNYCLFDPAGPGRWTASAEPQRGQWTTGGSASAGAGNVDSSTAGAGGSSATRCRRSTC